MEWPMSLENIVWSDLSLSRALLSPLSRQPCAFQNLPFYHENFSFRHLTKNATHIMMKAGLASILFILFSVEMTRSLGASHMNRPYFPPTLVEFAAPLQNCGWFALMLNLGSKWMSDKWKKEDEAGYGRCSFSLLGSKEARTTDLKSRDERTKSRRT